MSHTQRHSECKVYLPALSQESRSRRLAAGMSKTKSLMPCRIFAST